MPVQVIACRRMESSLAQSSDSECTSTSRIQQLKAAFEKASSETAVPLSPTCETNNNNNQKHDPIKNGVKSRAVPANRERKCLTLVVERTKAQSSIDAASKRITWSGADQLEQIPISPVPVPRVKSPKQQSPLPQNGNTRIGQLPLTPENANGTPQTAGASSPNPVRPQRPTPNRKASSTTCLVGDNLDTKPPRPSTPPGGMLRKLSAEAVGRKRPPKLSTPTIRKTSSGDKPLLCAKPSLDKDATKPSLPRKNSGGVSPAAGQSQDVSEWKRIGGPPAKPVPPSPRMRMPNKEDRRKPPSPPVVQNSVAASGSGQSTCVSPHDSDRRCPPPRPRGNSVDTPRNVKPPVPPTLRPCQSVVSSSSPLTRQKALTKHIDKSNKPLPRQRPVSTPKEEFSYSYAHNHPIENSRRSPLESLAASPQLTSIDDFINSVKRKYSKAKQAQQSERNTVMATMDDDAYHTLDDNEPSVDAIPEESLDDTYEPINGQSASTITITPQQDNDSSGDSLYWTVDESPEMHGSEDVNGEEEIAPLPPRRRSSLRTDDRRTSLASSCNDDSDQSSSEGSDYERPDLVKKGSTLGVFSPEAYMALSDVSEESSSTQDCYEVERIQQQLGDQAAEEDEDDDYSDEPLYQLYAAGVLSEERKRSRKSADEDSVVSDSSSHSDEEVHCGQRILWCQLASVRVSGVLDTLPAEERKRQEAMFEVITSEASYLKSLSVLVNHFMMATEFVPNTSVPLEDCILDRQQCHFLFTGVSAVKAVSEKFLHDLRARQEDGIFISSISDILLEYASKYFTCYIKYCANQIFRDRTLMTIVQENPRFCEVLSRLESSEKCQGLSMQSFMMLPMQRITRMPLLLDAICGHCEPGSDEFNLTDRALRATNKVVKECNEGARRMERTEQMYFIQQTINFKTRPIALISSSRWLLRRGQLSCIHDDSKPGKHRRPLRQLLKGRPRPIYLFLFTDLLLLAKMKGEDHYKVFDYCTRSMLRIEDETENATVAQEDGNVRSPSVGTEKYVFNLILLENSTGKTVDYLCIAQNETEKTRWLEALAPVQATPQDGETIYSEWDCPQVQAVHSYHAQQPDELNLQEGDVIKVLRKLADGWFEGQRLRDGEEGWFPANHTEEILSEHVRARNLLQRYRLIHASKVLVNMMQKQDS